MKLRLERQAREDMEKRLAAKVQSVRTAIEKRIRLENEVISLTQEKNRAEAVLAQATQDKLTAEKEALALVNAKAASEVAAVEAMQVRTEAERQVAEIAERRAIADRQAQADADERIAADIEAARVAKMRAEEQRLRDENHRQWCESGRASGFGPKTARRENSGGRYSQAATY